jgi:hypothetical protein
LDFAIFPSVTSVNGADGISDIEGKAARVAASECGQRASFNGADGISDIEGKAARGASGEGAGKRASFKSVVVCSLRIGVH